MACHNPMMYQVDMEDDDGDSKSSLLDHGFSDRYASEKQTRRRPSWAYASLGLNICFVVFCAIWVANSFGGSCSDPLGNWLLRLTSMPSPIFDDIHIATSKERRQGAVMPADPPSIWRQDPSPEVDDAWHRIANSSPIAITAQDVRKIGYDPAKVAKWPAEYGFGDDAYWARIDVFHQIHCLNMLRKAIHWEYYDDYEKASEACFKQKPHIAHCVHNLLQELMCKASTDPYVRWWIDSGETPMPDWSNERKCRDFNAILAYQEKHGVSMTKITNIIKKPPQAYRKTLSLEFKYMRGNIANDPAVNLTAAQLEDMEKHGGQRGEFWDDDVMGTSPDFLRWKLAVARQIHAPELHIRRFRRLAL